MQRNNNFVLIHANCEIGIKIHKGTYINMYTRVFISPKKGQTAGKPEKSGRYKCT